MVIRFFSKSEAHREFSNFAPFAIDLDGKRWPTTEHYYQAQKFADAEMQAKIRKAEKPIIAKNLADKHRDRTRPDWEAVKDEVMYRAVRRQRTSSAPSMMGRPGAGRAWCCGPTCSPAPSTPSPAMRAPASQ